MLNDLVPPADMRSDPHLDSAQKNVPVSVTVRAPVSGFCHGQVVLKIYYCYHCPFPYSSTAITLSDGPHRRLAVSGLIQGPAAKCRRGYP
jgi:hypothetical protein